MKTEIVKYAQILSLLSDVAAKLALGIECESDGDRESAMQLSDLQAAFFLRQAADALDPSTKKTHPHSYAKVYEDTSGYTAYTCSICGHLLEQFL